MSERPYRICFVCLGNICRSPMAEVVTRVLLDRAGLANRVHVSSTGTGDWHIGGPANPGTVRALRTRGYDGSRHRARQLTSATLGDYDLLIGLDPANLTGIQQLLRYRDGADRPEVALLRDFGPGGAAGLGVPDPYGMGDEAFERALDLVEEACRGLVEQLRTRFGPPDAPLSRPDRTRQEVERTERHAHGAGRLSTGPAHDEGTRRRLD